MARKVTELLKTFCESKRLTTDKVAVHGGTESQPVSSDQSGTSPDVGQGFGITPTLSTLSYPYFRPISKTCLTS